MKDPIRYEIRSELIIHPQGGWVSYEEYIKVKARLDHMQAIVQQLIDEKNSAQKKDSASEDKQKA